MHCQKDLAEFKFHRPWVPALKISRFDNYTKSKLAIGGHDTCL